MSLVLLEENLEHRLIDVVLGVPLVTSGLGFTRVFPQKYQLLLGSLKKSRFPFSCLLNVKKAQVLGKTHQGFRFGRSIFRKFRESESFYKCLDLKKEDIVVIVG